MEPFLHFILQRLSFAPQWTTLPWCLLDLSPKRQVALWKKPSLLDLSLCHPFIFFLLIFWSIVQISEKNIIHLLICVCHPCNFQMQSIFLACSDIDGLLYWTCLSYKMQRCEVITPTTHTVSFKSPCNRRTSHKFDRCKVCIWQVRGSFHWRFSNGAGLGCHSRHPPASSWRPHSSKWAHLPKA